MAGFGRRPKRPAREAPERDGPAEPSADPESVARTICLNLLSIRARTRSELASELTRRDVDDDP